VRDPPHVVVRAHHTTHVLLPRFQHLDRVDFGQLALPLPQLERVVGGVGPVPGRALTHVHRSHRRLRVKVPALCKRIDDTRHNHGVETERANKSPPRTSAPPAPVSRSCGKTQESE
jgi:hypothetical protein